MTMIVLNHPFDHKGSRVTTVSLRVPTVRDLRGLEGLKDYTEQGKTFWLVGQLAGLDPDALDSMSVVDVATIGEHVTALMEGNAGPKDSPADGAPRLST